MAYWVIKEPGSNTTISILKENTGSSIIIGKLTIEMLEILEKEGYVFNKDLADTKGISLKDAWRLNISEETAKVLMLKTFNIKKPIRDQSKKSEQTAVNNKTIDAMDVLLGLASYK